MECDLHYNVVDEVPNLEFDRTKLETSMNLMYANSAAFRTMMNYINSNGINLQIVLTDRHPLGVDADATCTRLSAFNYRIVISTAAFDGNKQPVDTNGNDVIDESEKVNAQPQILEMLIAHEIAHVVQKALGSKGSE
jgi:hypothetical protein